MNGPILSLRRGFGGITCAHEEFWQAQINVIKVLDMTFLFITKTVNLIYLVLTNKISVS